MTITIIKIMIITIMYFLTVNNKLSGEKSIAVNPHKSDHDPPGTKGYSDY